MGKNSSGALSGCSLETACAEILKRKILGFGQVGNLEDAASHFDLLCKIAGETESKSEMARYLICQYAFQHEFSTAFKIYGIFFSLGSDPRVLQDKVQTCHVLAHMLLPDHLNKAYEIWRGFSTTDLSDSLKWHWMQTGLALLKQCYKNSNSRLARKIYVKMQKFGASDQTKDFMRQADQLLAKAVWDK